MSTDPKHNQEEILESVQHVQSATSDEERKQWAEKASHAHEEVTHHALTYDEHGNIKTDTQDAKKCPMLH
ncbi:hypothetical protein BY458DRAFT_521424 [Sporodiniella umbellata]|nr:hypothetical protein BY458DRAFT_521424 [Sporodiniella umbellata]